MASRNTSPIRSTTCSRSAVASKYSATTITSSSPASRATSTIVNAEHGFYNPSVITAGPPNQGTTYLSLTVGTTITPELPKNPYVANVILRPELRWDTTLNDTTPFAGGTKRSTVTFGFDAIVPFTLK